VKGREVPADTSTEPERVYTKMCPLEFVDTG
jgi:hypothetical protein